MENDEVAMKELGEIFEGALCGSREAWQQQHRSTTMTTLTSDSVWYSMRA